MSGRAASTIALCLATACCGSADAPPEKVVLRVSAGHDLSSFGPMGSDVGSSAYASDLVRVGPVTAPYVPGPFEYDESSSNTTKLVLRRRDSAASDSLIDVIEIFELSQSDEWRKLHGRAIDVVPSAPTKHRARFDRMSSIRVVSLPSEAIMAVFFNTSTPTLADPDVRRAIALSLRTEAVANIACGEEDCARSLWGVEPPVGDPELPAGLSLMIVETDSSAADAASVIRRQLSVVKVDVQIEKVDVQVFVDRLADGDYELILNPIGVQLASIFELLGPNNIVGYESPAFRAAASRHDVDEAAAILAREVPAITLFEMRLFAAIDHTWCGGVPDNAASSWLWLKDLEPCETGP